MDNTKQLIIPYPEYEMMLKTIEAQKVIIEEFKKQPNIIIVDERPYSQVLLGVPKVTVVNKDFELTYLKREFDLLHEEVVKLTTITKQQNKKRKSWF